MSPSGISRDISISKEPAAAAGVTCKASFSDTDFPPFLRTLVKVIVDVQLGSV